MKPNWSLYLFCSSCLLLVSAVAADEPVELSGDQDRVIYSLGYELGRNIKLQELELESEVLLRGVRDAIDGERPLVDARQRQILLSKIRKARIEANLNESADFLSKKAEEEGVEVLSSGLQYRVLRAGEGASPGSADKVTVHYEGSLIDGTVFDSSYQRKTPAVFRVNRVIRGWSEALQLMQPGAKWELYIPANLAYGARGRGKKIPPNSALVFQVELISVN